MLNIKCTRIQKNKTSELRKEKSMFLYMQNILLEKIHKKFIFSNFKSILN